MRRFLRENGLSLTMLGLFLVAMAGQIVTGFRVDAEEQKSQGKAAPAFSEYLTSGHFVEAVFENWESEFLQMTLYVFLTAFLFQKGSPESRPLKPKTSQEKELRATPQAPWSVRKGGFVLQLYERSLSLALLLLFLLSFVLHACGGARLYNQELARQGESAVSTWQYLGTAQFWFESFQNWQSEFLSIAVLVILSIFLRQKGSPESKPVDAPHSETATESGG